MNEYWEKRQEERRRCPKCGCGATCWTGHGKEKICLEFSHVWEFEE